MAEHILIIRPGGRIATLIRSKIETASEDPLTEYEEIINELWNKLNDLRPLQTHHLID